MIKKYNKEIGFIYKNENNIDKIYKNNQLVFEQGFIREDSGSTPLTTSHLTTGKNLKGYKIYGNSRQNNLPDGYQEVEWIKAVGLINLGIKTNNNMQFEAKYLRTNTNTQYVYYSDTGSSSSTNTTAYASGNGVWRFGSKATAIPQSVNTIYETIQNKNGVWVNGEKIGSYTSVPTFTSSNNLRTFGTISGGSTPPVQLYYLKTKDYGANTYSHIWIPCKRTSDNSYGLYDIVGNEFYTNSEATITVGDDVVPTPSKPIEIESVGEKTINLFDISRIPASQVINNVTITNNGDGTLTFNGTSGSTIGVLVLEITNPIIITNPKFTNYIISGSATGTNSTNYLKTIDASYLTNEVSSATTASLNGQQTINRFFISIRSGDVFNNLRLGMFLYSGDTPTSYEPYYEGYKVPITVSDGTNSSTTNIYLDEPLRKIGDYADYIDFENGKVIRNIKEQILTGNESYANTSSSLYNGNTSTNRYVYMSKKPIIETDGTQNVSFCNELGWTSRVWSSDGNIGQTTNSQTQFHMRYLNTTLGIETTDDYSARTQKFKDYITAKYNSGNPVIIYYPLATPTEESITLPTIPSIKGTTIYSVGTNIQPSNMYIKYKGR